MNYSLVWILITTVTDPNNIDVRYALEERIQIQEKKESVWRFDKIVSMTIYFNKLVKWMDQFMKKIPMRSSAVINIQNGDKYCFLWSILAHFHPIANPKKGHATRVSNYRQCFDELNLEGYDFSNGFKCSDAHISEKIQKTYLQTYLN